MDSQISLILITMLMILILGLLLTIDAANHWKRVDKQNSNIKNKKGDEI